MSHFLRIILFLSVISLSGNDLYAIRLTADQALARALGEVSVKDSYSKIRQAQGESHTLAYQSESIYAFNLGENAGFIITPADDEIFPAVMGYADNGSIDMANAPCNFKWWLSMAEQSVADRIESEDYEYNIPAFFDPVDPLLSTKWGQENPYFDKCPVYYGQRCITGCVATAAAQIMNHYKYPASGKGSYSYVTRTNGMSVSCDFSSIVFDWQNMPYDPSWSGYTSDQREAVSTLMYACGVASSMDYAPQASGAYVMTIHYGLYKYFGYSTDMQYINRDTYYDEEWEYTIHKELSQGRPVLYRGDGENGGHAFVCDGYYGGMYHFNWGWDGKHDGYFIIPDLKPGDQDYSQEQYALIGIQPSHDGEPSEFSSFRCYGDFIYEADNNVFRLKEFYSYSPEVYSSCQMGLNVLNEKENELDEGTFIGSDLYPTFTLYDLNTGTGWGFKDRYMRVDVNLADGKYRLFPAYRVGDKWRRLRCPMDKQRYVTLLVKNGVNYFNHDLSGIDSELAQNIKPEVIVEQDGIRVEGLSKDSSITIFSVNGSTVYSGYVRGKIMLAKGFYLVKTGQEITKIVI